jgi:hypothetical protein
MAADFHRRLLVSDCHVAERICRMAPPIMLWSQTDIALLILPLVVIAERIASGFRDIWMCSLNGDTIDLLLRRTLTIQGGKL